MKVAVISDIHGNGAALDAVLADIDGRGVDAVYCLGDVALQGPDAARCVDRLRERAIPTVRGNTDRYLARGGGVPNLSPAEADAFLRPWREMLGPERLAWLGERPERVEVEWEGLRVLLVHGSPRSDEEPLLPWNGAGGGTGGAAGAGPGGAPDPEAEGPLAGVTADLVLFGHHHRQLAWRQDGRWMVGPGSVGMPFDEDPRAAYALIEVRPTVRPTGRPPALDIALIRVPYDLEATVAAHRRAGLAEHNPLFPEQLRQARQQPRPPR